MFALDPNAAKAADVKSAFIQNAGKYKGTILLAEYIENAEKGSKNIRLVFKSDEGQEASFFLNMVYQFKEQNATNHKLLSAILTTIQLRNTGNTQPQIIKKWDAQSRQDVDTQALVFPDLAGKKIGFLIQMEIDKKSQDGRARPIIYLPFCHNTERTASEILAVPPAMKPEVLPKAVQYIADHPLIDRRPKGAQAATMLPASNAPAADQFDDDIPF